MRLLKIPLLSSRRLESFQSKQNLLQRFGLSANLLQSVMVTWGILLAAYAVSRWLTPKALDFIQWDNRQLYIPSIVFAQNQILHGSLPVWNAAQHMGEPILGLAQFGVFYPFYTLSFAISSALRLPPSGFCQINFLLHLMILSSGCIALFLRLGIRSLLAMCGAVTVCTVGLVVQSASVWIFTLATLTWIPWALFAGQKIIESRKEFGASICLSCFTALYIAVGNVQHSLYAGLAITLVLAGQALLMRRIHGLIQVIFIQASGALMAMPTLLPVLRHFPFTARIQSYHFEDFLAQSLSWKVFVGLLTPLFWNGGGYPSSRSILMYHGPWMITALVMAVVGWRNQVSTNAGTNRLQYFFISGLGASVVLLVFAMGESTPIYGWTYGLPIWSSFRCPRKFGLFFTIIFLLAGTAALEIVARSALKWTRINIASAAIVLTLTLAAFTFDAYFRERTAIKVFLLSSTLACPLLLLFTREKILEHGLLWFSVVTGITSVVLVQEQGFHSPEERTPGMASILGISPDYRVLPLATYEFLWNRTDVGLETGLFQSATSAGYRSVTGSTTALASRFYLEWLPSTPAGTLPLDSYRKLLGSNLLKSFNVKYVSALLEDFRAMEIVKEAKGLIPLQTWRQSQILALPESLPRSYFASHLFIYSKSALLEGMVANQKPVRSAFVETMPNYLDNTGVVRKMEWGQNGQAIIGIDAPRGGFLIVSESFDSNWRAESEGRQLKIIRTNGAIFGIEIPPGIKTIRLYFDYSFLRWSLALAAVGVSLSLLFPYLQRPLRTTEPCLS